MPGAPTELKSGTTQSRMMTGKYARCGSIRVACVSPTIPPALDAVMVIVCAPTRFSGQLNVTTSVKPLVRVSGLQPRHWLGQETSQSEKGNSY